MPLMITKKSVHEIQADMIIYIREKESPNTTSRGSFLQKCIQRISMAPTERRVRYVHYTAENFCANFEKVYLKTLKWAVRHRCRTVAVSCNDEVAYQLARQSGKEFAAENNLHVYLCLPKNTEFPPDMLAKVLAILPHFEEPLAYERHQPLDSKPIDYLAIEEIFAPSVQEDKCVTPALDIEDLDEDCAIWEEDAYLAPQASLEQPKEAEYKDSLEPRAPQAMPPKEQSPRKQEMPRPQAAFPQAERPKASGSFRAIQEFLKQNDAGFKDTLLKYIDRSGKKDSEVYKKANVDRRLFSKIMNVQGYNPSKPTAIAFAIALELDLEETRDLIGRAGYTLSHASNFDRIIEFFILEGNYDIYEINEALFYFDQSLLGC